MDPAKKDDQIVPPVVPVSIRGAEAGPQMSPPVASELSQAPVSGVAGVEAAPVLTRADISPEVAAFDVVHGADSAVSFNPQGVAAGARPSIPQIAQIAEFPGITLPRPLVEEEKLAASGDRSSGDSAGAKVVIRQVNIFRHIEELKKRKAA